MPKALLYRPEMTIPQSVKPQNGKAFTLKELQDFMGGNIELIPLPNGNDLWVNENGKNDGLPYNETATKIWRKIFKGYAIGADDYVVGNCLICSPKLTHDE